MRFSVALYARSMQPADDRSVILAMIEHAKHAEALGFAAVFSPDHHFTGYAPWASDAFMFASYLAATLKKAYLGFSVTTVPLHNPVRFAERVNLLDQLSEGRLLVGVGSGTTPEESIGFGVKFQDASRMMEENLSVAEALWNKQIDDEPFQFDTGTYKGAIVQRIAPAAYTKPHARLIGVAMRDSSIERVAKNAWPAFIPAFTPPQLGSLEPFVHFTKWFTKYRNALNSYGHSEQAIQDALSWTTHTLPVRAHRRDRRTSPGRVDGNSHCLRRCHPPRIHLQQACGRDQRNLTPSSARFFLSRVDQDLVPRWQSRHRGRRVEEV